MCYEKLGYIYIMRVYGDRDRVRQTDRQTDRQTARQTGRQTIQQMLLRQSERE